MAKLTTQDFINKACAVHGDKYDYSKVEYVNANTRVQIICHIHGPFTQTPANHLRGQGCPTCGFIKRKENQLFWTEDKINEELKKYRTMKELRTRAPRLYNAIRKRKMDVSFLTKANRDNYTFEEILLCAKGYLYKKDFKNAHSNMYSAAQRHGWLKLFDWFEIPPRYNGDMTSKNHLVYVYEYPDVKIAYIGLTNNIKRRHSEHTANWKGHVRSAVYEFSSSFNIDIPQPIILESNLTPEESQAAEDKWVKKYCEAGWCLLNKAKTGIGVSSLGAYRIIWDYESCKEEAKRYSTPSEYMIFARGAYAAALSNGWVEEFYPYKQQKMARTKENFLLVSHLYKTTGEFIKKNPSMYRYGRNNGFLKDCIWLKTGHQISKWTLESCLEEAKKYNSFSEFILGSPNAHRAMNRNGYREEILKYFDSIK